MFTSAMWLSLLSSSHKYRSQSIQYISSAPHTGVILALADSLLVFGHGCSRASTLSQGFASFRKNAT